MISYAQNGEDVVLARAFPPGHRGFYIDVGAAGPIIDSVTKHFYDQGWTGVNIEPADAALEELRLTRKRDVNLGVVIGRSEGTAAFYQLPPNMIGCSTVSRELAEAYEREGWPVSERQVPMTTLTEVCAQYADDRVIDFLKIDVEGEEAAVLAGADFDRFRPRVLVVEATQPGTTIPSYEGWEPSVLEAGYEFVLFDGLNRFYVREEDGGLAELIAAPANVFDDYIAYACSRWRDAARHAEQVQQEASAAEQSARDARARIETELRSAQQEAQDVRVANDTAQFEVRSLQSALRRTQERLAASQRALRDCRIELNATLRGAAAKTGAE